MRTRLARGDSGDLLIFNINLNRCALCASSVHQLSRLSQRSRSVFVLAVSLSQSMRPSLHSVSFRTPVPRWLYPVSPRQLLQSDTGVPHFALDPLTYRCLLSLSPAADFAEPRPPHHNMVSHIAMPGQYEGECGPTNALIIRNKLKINLSLNTPPRPPIHHLFRILLLQ